MEKRNLVVRVPDKLDRRQKLIYLTSKGKEMQDELIRLAQSISTEAEQGIDKEKLRIFREVLNEIYRNVSK
jgi:DNA-binding MarR family transcriptional regulator